MMELNFSELEPSLAGVQSDFGQGLDSVGNVGMDVDCSIYDAIGSNSKD
jgi:hypothetical protein